MNLAPIAVNPVANLERTQIWRQRISDAQRGRVMTDRAKALLRAANLGKKQSPETIEKRVVALRGRKRPADVRLAVSKALKGRPLSEEHIAALRSSHGVPLIARNVDTGEVLCFRNGTFAADYFGCSKGAIYANVKRGVPARAPNAKLFGWTLSKVER